jgi:hypothetical protein
MTGWELNPSGSGVFFGFCWSILHLSKWQLKMILYCAKWQKNRHFHYGYAIRRDMTSVIAEKKKEMPIIER